MMRPSSTLGTALTAGLLVAGAQSVWDLWSHLAASPLPSRVTTLQTLRHFSALLDTTVGVGLLLAAPALAALSWDRRRRSGPAPFPAGLCGAALALLLLALAGSWTTRVTLWQTLRPLVLSLVVCGLYAVVSRRRSRSRSHPAGTSDRPPSGLDRLVSLAGAAAVILWLLPGALSAARGWLRPVPPPDRPDLVLLVLDTTRFDSISFLGGPAGLTPAIDRLAEGAEVFSRATATSAWTLPSHASIFTGRLPARHGATYATWKLRDDLPTLAEGLHRMGYDTGAWSANALVSRATSLDRGFAEFHELWRAGGDRSFLLQALRRTATEGLRRWGDEPDPARLPDATRSTGEAIEWTADRDRPFFLFINYFEPHGSYDPPEPFRSSRLATLDLSEEERRQIPRLIRESGLPDLPLRVLADRLSWSPRELSILRALYDAEVAFVDSEIGRLTAALERRETAGARPTVLVVTSDHGEHFGEHGRVAHHFSLYQELLHVPLIIRDSRASSDPGETARHDEVVSLRELYFFLLEMGRGAPAATALPGRGGSGRGDSSRGRALAELDVPLDLIARFTADDPSLDRPVFHRRWWAALHGHFKVLWSPPEDPRLYDLEADPRERRDLGAREPREVATGLRLLERAGAFEAVEVEGGSQGLDPETRRRLQALGYL